MQQDQADGSRSTDLRDAVRRFLEAPRAAALATVGEDGAPHQALVWYRLEPGDLILVNSLVGRRWPAELRRTGRAALAIANARNELSWVGLATEVVSVDDDVDRARADIVALAYRYQGTPTPEYLAQFADQRRVTFRLRITAVHDHLRAPDA
jgi:PPOX class probable F420-dependent enzyme